MLDLGKEIHFEEELIEVCIFVDGEVCWYQLIESTQHWRQKEFTFDLDILIILEAAVKPWRSMFQKHDADRPESRSWIDKSGQSGTVAG